MKKNINMPLTRWQEIWYYIAVSRGKRKIPQLAQSETPKKRNTEMTYKEAKELAANGSKVYEARYDGEVWSAGRMVEVGDIIGYYATREEAEKACRDYEICEFDQKHMETSVEERDGEFFE